MIKATFFVPFLVLKLALPSLAQMQYSTGGLRVVTYDPQSMFATKRAISGTDSSGSSPIGGGGAKAFADIELSDGTMTVEGVSGNTRTKVSHTGFTVNDPSAPLGTSVLSAEAYTFPLTEEELNLIDPATLKSTQVSYNAYSQIELIREANSFSPSFLSSFSNLFQ